MDKSWTGSVVFICGVAVGAPMVSDPQSLQPDGHQEAPAQESLQESVYLVTATGGADVRAKTARLKLRTHPAHIGFS